MVAQRWGSAFGWARAAVAVQAPALHTAERRDAAGVALIGAHAEPSNVGVCDGGLNDVSFTDLFIQPGSGQSHFEGPYISFKRANESHAP
jgi:hypothetical protein